MNEDERQFLLGMKATLESYLLLIDDRIINYKPESNDEKHDFPTKKAIMFRDALRNVNENLN